MNTNRVHRVLHKGLPRSGRFAAGLAIMALVGAFGAGSGIAGAQDPSTCSVSAATVQPFLPWNDQSSYFLAPGGSFEQKLKDWHLSGAVKIAKNSNETFYVNDPSDSNSLAFGPNSSAQTPNICVSIHSPSIRLFAMNSGDPSSTMQVTVNYTDQNGKAQTAQVGSISASSTWAPTDSMLFLNNIAPVVGGQGQTSVSFTFRVIGAGNWQIDDFYVDPIKSQEGNTFPCGC